MSNISVSLPADGDTIDASDYNTPITTIVNDYNGNIDNSNIAAAAAIAGSKLADGGITNAKLSTATGQPGAVWQTWTPTFVNLSGGTLNWSKYLTIGKTTFYRWKYTLAGAGVGSGVTFTLPVAANADYTGDIDIGDANLVDSGSQLYRAWVSQTSATVGKLFLQTVTGANIIGTATLSSTAPFTWGAADYIVVQGFYENA